MTYKCYREIDQISKPMFNYLEEGIVPDDKRRAARLVAEAQDCILCDEVLYHLYKLVLRVCLNQRG